MADISPNLDLVAKLKNKKKNSAAEGWRYTAFITGFVGFIGLALYPIVIGPMIDVSEYKEIQKVARKNINQEDIQPGNMKVWSDPFDRKKPDRE